MRIAVVVGPINQGAPYETSMAESRSITDAHRNHDRDRIVFCDCGAGTIRHQVCCLRPSTEAVLFQFDESGLQLARTVRDQANPRTGTWSRELQAKRGFSKL